MVPVGRARLGRQVVHGAPIAASTASASALASKTSTVRGGSCPVARHRHVAAQAGRDGSLAGRRRVLVLGADLEQRRIAQAARLVALRGVDQVGQDRGPHGVERGVDRVQQTQVRLLLRAEPLGLGARQERPGHGLVHAARAERPAGQRHAALQRRAHRLGRGRQARQRRRRDVVEAVDAGHFLDQVGLADDVGPPRRHRRRPRAAAVDAEAELGQDRGGLVGRHVDRRQRLHAIGTQRVAALPVGHDAARHDLARLAAAQLEDQARGDIGAPLDRLRDRCRARSGSARRTGCRACGRRRRCRSA